MASSFLKTKEPRHDDEQSLEEVINSNPPESFQI